MGAQTGAVTRHGHLRDLGLPTVFGAIVLLVSATLLLGANISALRGNLDRMAHSQNVLTQVDILEGAVLSEEMTVRGYALTGDRRFVQFQNNERRRSLSALAELKRLAAVEKNRVGQFQTLERDNRRHLEIFGKLAVDGPDRVAVVTRAIIDPAVRENMRHVRRGIETLRAAELNDLGVRQRDSTDQLGRAFFLAIGIILTAFLLGGVGVWVAQLKAPLNR